MDKKTIGARLVKLRGERTQQSIAKEAGISQSTYAMYELGQRRPTDENKMALARVFGRTVQEIFF